MTPLDRRSFLKGAAAVTAGTALTGPAFSAALAVEPGAVFQYGVASGDPLPDGVVIWTRATPSPDATPGSGGGAPTTVGWFVRDGSRVVQRGTVRTSADRDHTVKVDVRGLQPARTYSYGFTVAGQASPVGTTRTAPSPDASNERLRFGMVSCSNYTGGYFSAYRHLADRDDLDFVLHLGDYLYEYGNDADRYGPESLRGERDHDPATEMVTLEDYRRRHALYKADPVWRRCTASTPSSPPGTTTRSPTTPGARARRTTSPTARASTSRAATARTRSTTSGCRSGCRSRARRRRCASTAGCASARWPT